MYICTEVNFTCIYSGTSTRGLSEIGTQYSIVDLSTKDTARGPFLAYMQYIKNL